MTAVDITGVLGSVWGEATERESFLEVPSFSNASLVV